MKETTKAMKRRVREDFAKMFPWREIFAGDGIDVGCGDDPVAGCIRFDQQDGDANHLSRYFSAHSFDFLHGSQVLEHMRDPRAAIRDWIKVVRPGGYIIQTVPDWVAYEGMHWPSRYNPDHKSSWSMIYRGSIAPTHIHIPTFLEELNDVAETKLARFVDDNYNYKLGTSVDQTFREQDGVECWNEFVLKVR